MFDEPCNPYSSYVLIFVAAPLLRLLYVAKTPAPEKAPLLRIAVTASTYQLCFLTQIDRITP